MDALEIAAVERARDALNIALTEDVVQTREAQARAKCKAFIQFCARHLGSGPQGPDWTGVSRLVSQYVERAGAGARGELLDPDDDLARHWLGSIADLSLLDSLARYAMAVPPQVSKVMVAAGATGSSVEESGLKLVRKLSVSKGEVSPLKALAAVAVTREMLNAGGPQFLARFEQELASAVTAASNAEVLAFFAALAGSNQIAVASVGDPLADLRAGLQAAEASHGYVIAAAPGQVADLATRVEAKPGFTVRGGEFRPGIRIVAVDGHEGMTIIPASPLAIFDGGLDVRSAGEASVNVADSAEAPAVLVSLWQTGTLGLLAERHFHIAGRVLPVTVGGAS